MRQTFTFAESTHKPPQALAALKNRVRKYVKRERRKPLPEGVDFWDFSCKVGETEETATDVHISEVTNLIEAVFDAGDPTVYVEIISKPGVRNKSAKPATTSSRPSTKPTRHSTKSSRPSTKSSRPSTKSSRSSTKSDMDSGKPFKRPSNTTEKPAAKPFKRSSEPSHRAAKPVKDTAKDDQDTKPSSSWSFS